MEDILVILLVVTLRLVLFVGLSLTFFLMKDLLCMQSSVMMVMCFRYWSFIFNRFPVINNDSLDVVPLLLQLP